MWNDSAVSACLKKRRILTRKTNYLSAGALFLITSALLSFSLPLSAQSIEEAKQFCAQGNELFNQGKYQEALPLLERSLAICEQVLGPHHPDTVGSLNNLAEVHRSIGNYSKALPMYERALEILKKALSPQHALTALIINNIALVYFSMGDYGKAVPLLEKSLAIREKVLGSQHPDTANSLDNLASVYKSMGDYAKALSLQGRSLAIREKVFGPQHPHTAMSLNNLAVVYRSMGDYAKALPLYERSLAINEKVLGPQHPHTAMSLNNLAEVYRSICDYSKALPLHERAFEIQERVLGPQHPDTAKSLMNLAVVYYSLCDYSKALPLFERSLAIRKKVFGSQHPDTADGLSALAGAYYSMSDYAKALPLLEESLAICEKVLGPQHSRTAGGLSDLAGAYYSIGDYAKALPLLERSLVIREKVLGSQHPDTADSFNNLAAVYQSMGVYTDAQPLFEESLAICEKVLGPQHPRTAGSLSNLSDVYQCMGDYAKALPLLERSLVIREKVLGSQHPDTAESLNKLSYLAYCIDDLPTARNYASRQIAAKQSELQSILLLDERTRLIWQQKNLSYWSACVIPPQALAELTLRQKGVVLDSLIEDRAAALAAGASGEGASILQQIKSLQGRLSKIVFEKGREKEASKMQDEIGVLQRSLVSKFLGRDRQRASVTITMDEVASRLDGGSLLMDFIQFADPKLKGEEAWCYGAVLTTEKNQSSFVRIDGAKAIDRAIDALRVAINQGDDQAVESQTRFLSQKLWEPLAKHIPPETTKLVLCPDANLNFLSFATLLDSSGRFIAEKYQVSYVGSARDLVRQSSVRQDKTLALFANPSFDAAQPAANTKDMLAMRSAEADVYGMLSLPALPATEKEAGTLGNLASDSGWNARIALGSQATEQAVRGVKRPGILHLATHGFYLASYSPPAPNGSRGMSVVGFQETVEEKKKNEKGVDPMRASGVALTGAQRTLKLWSQQKAPDPENDGILTAEEVGAIDLTGTWLVTLSACETGVGEARSGEGVFGLRRAFMIAGAENLLMTLWPVNDASTADFMADFYREALASGDAPGALAEVQREWLVRLRNQKGLLAAVRDAGPFVMATTGRPNRFTQFSKKPDFGFIK